MTALPTNIILLTRFAVIDRLKHPLLSNEAGSLSRLKVLSGALSFASPVLQRSTQGKDYFSLVYFW